MIVLIHSLLLLFALFILFWICSMFLGFLRTSVPFIPTARRDIRTIVERVPLSSSDVIYDLGSGNGKIVFALERLTGAQTVGIEAMLWTHWYAQLKRLLIRSEAHFILDNFFNQPLGEATVIYCYLYPPLMRQIGEKALAECRPGTRLIVRDFPIPNLKQIDYFKTYGKHEVFVYQV